MVAAYFSLDLLALSSASLSSCSTPCWSLVLGLQMLLTASAPSCLEAEWIESRRPAALSLGLIQRWCQSGGSRCSSLQSSRQRLWRGLDHSAQVHLPPLDYKIANYTCSRLVSIVEDAQNYQGSGSQYCSGPGFRLRRLLQLVDQDGLVLQSPAWSFCFSNWIGWRCDHVLTRWHHCSARHSASSFGLESLPQSVALHLLSVA